jgi:hypothetical protein
MHFHYLPPKLTRTGIEVLLSFLHISNWANVAYRSSLSFPYYRILSNTCVELRKAERYLS